MHDLTTTNTYSHYFFWICGQVHAWCQLTSYKIRKLKNLHFVLQLTNFFFTAILAVFFVKKSGKGEPWRQQVMIQLLQYCEWLVLTFFLPSFLYQGWPPTAQQRSKFAKPPPLIMTHAGRSEATKGIFDIPLGGTGREASQVNFSGCCYEGVKEPVTRSS